MSIELLKLLEQSKTKAIGKGEIINLRKTDITKEHLVTKKVKKFDYTWYQTPSKVGIEIPYIIENKEDLKVKFQAEKVTIEFPIKNGGDYHLELELFKTIIPERSKKNHRLDKIEIVMQKKQQNYNWLALRKDGQGIPEAKQQEQVLYPSSSKNKRNWDKIDKQIQSQIQRHGQQYGEDPSMNFFKQIFCQGDQQKRRAMIKSYQTSGGTVLSTDWADVAKKDYEGRDRPSPPKGQQWKKREI